MNRQSVSFLITFSITAAVVGPLVYAGLPLYGLVAGFVGLIVHWLVSRGGDSDGEVADSSYFFGFLLTLVFLAVGLYRVGVAMTGDGSGSTAGILTFLADLAAGLMLTIGGLLIRQVRTLAGEGRVHMERARTEREQSERSQQAVLHQLAENMRRMMELWEARPEHQVVDLLHESRSAAREAADRLEGSMAAAANRMIESVQRLDEATSDATQQMTRSAAGAGSAMSEMAQRLEVEIQHVVTSLQREVSQALASIEQQRRAADEALAQARNIGTRLVQDAETQHREQVELWRANLEHARTALARAHTGLDEEYRRSMEGFVATSTAFAQLTDDAVKQVSSLPNPAERLAGLWDGVRRLESDLTQAISGSVTQLAALRDRSAELQSSLGQLGGSVDSAAARIGTGGDRLGSALQHELQQMNTIIEEYVTLLERSGRQLKVRA